MAEVDTLMLSQEHSDIRREAVEHTNEIVKEGIKGDYATQSVINGATTSTSNQLDMFEDVTNANFMTVSRDTADLRAQTIALGYQVRDGFFAAAKDAEINALKVQVDAAKNTTYLSDKIDGQAEKTRELINALNDQGLNRQLIERNSELVEERGHARHWRGHYDNAQFAALTSQLNAFQSQLAETRQGMVNFGTMAGVGQTSTANNVR